jgi:hypothetical protein
MMRWLAGVCFSLAACQPAPVGVQNVELQRDSTPQCASQCAQIGLPLDSVVIMANNVGCVCRAVQPPAPGTAVPPAPEAGAAPGASASVGGMAAIMIAQEAERRRRSADDDASRRRRQQNSAPKPYRPKY